MAKGSWPEGAQLVLLDSAGQVLWVHTVEQDLAQALLDALARATTLRIVLPDGTETDVAVAVRGDGKSLGEVKVVVDERLVPLSELVRASMFGLRDGLLMLIRGESGCEGSK